MENRLREYMDDLFGEIPPTKQAVELKEEILQNLIDKYHDLLAEGKSPEAAFNISVASVGDVDELLSGLTAGYTPHPCQDQETYIKQKRKSALLFSTSIMLYILCVLPVIIADSVGYDIIGVCLMFLMIATATGLLIYNHMTHPRYAANDGTIIGDFREWQEYNSGSRQTFRAVNSAVWTLATVLYLIISFSTMRWNVTWIIFLIAAAVQSIIRAAFELRK